MKNDMTKKIEKIISPIVLKYYKSPASNDPHIQRFLCARCLKNQPKNFLKSLVSNFQTSLQKNHCKAMIFLLVRRAGVGSTIL